MTVTHVPVVVIAGRHTFAGVIDHSNLRVLDVLNDVGTDFLRVLRVEVFRHFQGERLEQLSEAVVPKAAIDCLILCEDTHEAPLRRQYSFVEKQPRTVFVTLADYEIRGNIMVKGNPDPRQTLGRDAPLFFPIAEATVSSIDKIGPPIAAPVVLVNKVKTSLLQIENEVPLNLRGI